MHVGSQYASVRWLRPVNHNDCNIESCDCIDAIREKLQKHKKVAFYTFFEYGAFKKSMRVGKVDLDTVRYTLLKESEVDQHFVWDDHGTENALVSFKISRSRMAKIRAKVFEEEANSVTNSTVWERVCSQKFERVAAGAGEEGADEVVERQRRFTPSVITAFLAKHDPKLLKEHGALKICDSWNSKPLDYVMGRIQYTYKSKPVLPLQPTSVGDWIAMAGCENDGTHTIWIGHVINCVASSADIRWLRYVNSAIEEPVIGTGTERKRLANLLASSSSPCFTFYEYAGYRKSFRQTRVKLTHVRHIIMRKDEVVELMRWKEKGSKTSINRVFHVSISPGRRALMERTLLPQPDTESESDSDSDSDSDGDAGSKGTGRETIVEDYDASEYSRAIRL
eukprot:g4814.t1